MAGARSQSLPCKPLLKDFDRQSYWLVLFLAAGDDRQRIFFDLQVFDLQAFYSFQPGQIELSFRTNLSASLWASRFVAKE